MRLRGTAESKIQCRNSVTKLETMQRKMEQQARSLFASGKSLRMFFEYVFEKSKGLELAAKTIPHDTAVSLLRCKSLFSAVTIQ